MILKNIPDNIKKFIDDSVHLSSFVYNTNKVDKWLHWTHNGKILINTEILRNLLLEDNWTLKNISGIYQQMVLEVCYFNQDWKDPFNGQPFNTKLPIHLHHALLTKNDVKGLPEQIKFLIHNPLNCIAVGWRTHFENKKIQNRKYNAKMLLKTYGEENKEVLERFLRDFPISTTIKNYYEI